MQPEKQHTGTLVGVDPQQDKWLRIIGIPVAVLPFVFFYLEEYGYDWRLFLMTFVWGVVSTATAWWVLFWWVMRVRSRFTRKSETGRRVFWTFAGYSLFTLILQPAETWGIAQIDPTGLMAEPEFPRTYVIHICLALTFVIIVGGYYEVTYYLYLYRQAVAESEAFQKARLQSQLDGLKNQVNPHFLFNSLNSLSALIWEDRQRAGEFLDELATVYRYLLQSSQCRLMPLRNETNFIRSFFFLLQTRYGAALELELDTQNAPKNRYLPPMTLQILVENAIRHNVTEADRPLRIRVEVGQETIIVTNTIQRKKDPVARLSGGLSHLDTLYGTLGLSRPRITDDGRTFRVELELAQDTEDLVALS